ncbi:hypothetical protein AMTR_s00028p00049870 [Amborella trichopoda]|uniref:Uncharacterized protein n=1 Tax=Amborella trichopoda TaxID=13333 RepID=W1PRT7_AMBTC|nr:hypothetical protein AMTR_s00028p00049870 [Amborella trichopoda]
MQTSKNLLAHCQTLPSSFRCHLAIKKLPTARRETFHLTAKTSSLLLVPHYRQKTTEKSSQKLSPKSPSSQNLLENVPLARKSLKILGNSRPSLPFIGKSTVSGWNPPFCLLLVRNYYAAHSCCRRARLVVAKYVPSPNASIEHDPWSSDAECVPSANTIVSTLRPAYPILTAVHVLRPRVPNFHGSSLSVFTI